MPQRKLRRVLTIFTLTFVFTVLILLFSAQEGLKQEYWGFRDELGLPDRFIVMFRYKQFLEESAAFRSSIIKDLRSTMRAFIGEVPPPSFRPLAGSYIPLPSFTLEELEEVKKIPGVLYVHHFLIPPPEDLLTVKEVAAIFAVEPLYFQVERLKFKWGSNFSKTASSKEIILNEPLSRDLFGEENPTGRPFPPNPLYTIAGVVYEEEGSLRLGQRMGIMDLGLDPPSPIRIAYVPPTPDLKPSEEYLQTLTWLGITFYVYPERKAIPQVISSIREMFNHKLKPGLVLQITGGFTDKENIEGVVGISSRREQIKIFLIVFTIVSLVALINLLFLLYLEVNSRQREFGIKLSIGASRLDLVWENFQNLALLVAIPFFLALLLSLFLAPRMGWLVYANPVVMTYVGYLGKPLSLTGRFFLGLDTFIYALLSFLLLLTIASLPLIYSLLRFSPKDIYRKGGLLGKTGLASLLVIIISTSFIFVSLNYRSQMEREFTALALEVGQGNLRLVGKYGAELKEEDLEYLKSKLGERVELAITGRQKMQYMFPLEGEEMIEYMTLEVTPQYFSLRGLSLKEGRPPYPGEKDTCVIGSEVASFMDLKIDSYYNPDGSILDSSLPSGLKVVGILSTSLDPLVNLTLYAPLGSLRETMRPPPPVYRNMLAKPSSNEDRVKITEEIRALLSHRFGREVISKVIDIEELMKNITIFRSRTFLIFTLAAILSLVIGSFTFMDHLFLAVLKRFKEIGVKRAIGASKKEIFLEFLRYGIVSALLAGIGGVILGGVSSFLLSRYYGTEFILELPWVLVTLLVVFLVGLASSLLPSNYASRIEPREAIRNL